MYRPRPGIVRLDGRREPAPIPVEIQDAVELWARGVGRHARVVWIHEFDPPVPQVRLTLKPDDGRLEAWKLGLTDEEPVETVELMEWDAKRNRYVPLNLTELGAAGVVALLEKGNMWSGRGEFGSLQEAVVAARTRGQAARDRIRQAAREDAKALAEDRRRGILEIPYHRVGIDLQETAG